MCLSTLELDRLKVDARDAIDNKLVTIGHLCAIVYCHCNTNHNLHTHVAYHPPTDRHRY
jgi:hypothetical protein